MINQQIPALVALKKIDDQRLARQQDIAELQKAMADIDKTLASGSSDVAEVEQAISEKKKVRDRLELDTKAQQSQIDKLTGQMRDVSTNREYDALKSEIGKLEADKSRAEDKILQAMMDLEALEETLKQSREVLDEGKQKLAVKKNEHQGEIEQLKTELASLDEARAEATRELKPDVLQMYDRVLALRGDHGVVQADAESQVCQGCFTQLTLQTISMLMIGRELIQCPVCDRFLYLEDVVKRAAESPEESSTPAGQE